MPIETTPIRSPKARILVVDDDASTREVFGELLQRWGYDVEQTGDGHDALKITAERHPDVIISDLVMPKLDGLALTRALREESPDTPVIIITGKGTIDADPVAGGQCHISGDECLEAFDFDADGIGTRRKKCKCVVPAGPGRRAPGGPSTLVLGGHCCAGHNGPTRVSDSAHDVGCRYLSRQAGAQR